MHYNQTQANFYKKIKKELDSRADAVHGIRVGLGEKIVEITPTYQNDNIRPGTVAGLFFAAGAAVVERYSPVPITADTEIAETESVEGGIKYTVNVDAVIPQQGRFQAMAESGQGFVSFFTDDFDVQNQSVAKKRVSRDTYQFEVVVSETDERDSKEKIGLGILQDIAE